MRDIILSAFIVGLLPLILRRPVYGALAWVWISMMNPHSLTYGFAARMPWAMMIAVVTLVGFLFTRDRKPLPMNGGTVLILLLLGWMSITSLSAMNPDGDYVLGRWILAAKIIFMLLVTFMLLRGPQINWLLWTMVVSVGYYGFKGGLWTLATGGGGRVWGPPGGFLTDNNSLAIGLVLLLPWMFYLREVSSHKWVRRGLVFAMIAVAFGILGSQSRGALLAVVSMALVLGIKSKKFIRTSVGLAVIGTVAIVFMPDSWTKRMDTIQTYQADTSAMSRIWTWKTLWNAAVDHPLTGAGFGADNQLVFQKYAPMDGGFEIFKGHVYVAHSIYFQALGEHGFVGLALYLALGVWTWLAASSLAKRTRDDPAFSNWVPLLMRMTQASLVGFAVGGSFLSLMLLDLSFYIPGVVILVKATVDEHVRPQAAAGSVPAAGRPMGAQLTATAPRS